MADQRRLLELALKGLEAEQATLQEEIAAIRRGLGSRPAESARSKAASGTATKGTRLSAAHRKRISAAMKLRYAQKRSAATSAARQMSS